MLFVTDIADFLACRHLTSLDRAERAGEISKPFFSDPGVELLRELGLRHERSYLYQLAEQGDDILEIADDIPWEEAVERTLEALRSGREVVYQATFQEGDWGGRADFLVRVDQPSDFGPWSYEVVETKLARSTKARAVIQLCFYSDLLSRIQGLEPEYMHIVLGGGANKQSLRVQRYLAYFRKVRREFEQAYLSRDDTYHFGAREK